MSSLVARSVSTKIARRLKKRPENVYHIKEKPEVSMVDIFGKLVWFVLLDTMTNNITSSSIHKVK